MACADDPPDPKRFKRVGRLGCLKIQTGTHAPIINLNNTHYLQLIAIRRDVIHTRTSKISNDFIPVSAAAAKNKGSLSIPGLGNTVIATALPASPTPQTPKTPKHIKFKPLFWTNFIEKIITHSDTYGANDKEKKLVLSKENGNFMDTKITQEVLSNEIGNFMDTQIKPGVFAQKK